MSGGKEEEENLWSKILTEVQSRSSSSLPAGSVVVLGDAGSGKTSLVSRLERREEVGGGGGLEYHFLEVNPDVKDGSYAYSLGSGAGDVTPGESGRVGVWVLGGEASYAPLLQWALPRVGAGSGTSVVVLTVSMSEPWTVLESLERWAGVVEGWVGSREGRETSGRQREAQVRFWQEYVEPLDSSSHSDLGAKVPSMETEHIVLPLSESTLTRNLGLPLLVVLTKCDVMPSLEKDYDFKDETFDFIQQHVRKFCLSFGAALFYTSAKEGRNCDVLYKYILHRLYESPFTHPASVVEKDSIFIPAGWDNEKKIGILYENLRSLRPDDRFSEHIRKPVLRRPQAKETDVIADDDQAFLSKQQALIHSQPAPSPGPQKTVSQVRHKSSPRSNTRLSANLPPPSPTPAPTRLLYLPTSVAFPYTCE